MKIRQIRNATILLSIGDRRILVDPMLCNKSAMPGFKVLGGGRQRNPLVDLPDGTAELLESVTDVLITHEHPDHFDQAGLNWARARSLPVLCNAIDFKSLKRKGLRVQAIEDGPIRGEVVRSKHGRGLLGWLMGPVAGYYLEFPGEPTLYLVGDSVLTSNVLSAIDRLGPDIIVVPAGAANMGIGGNILFSLDELVALTQLASGRIVFNHLEALDHCPTTREGLHERMRAEGLLGQVQIPLDGEELSFEAEQVGGSAPSKLLSSTERPGIQKWMTEKFSGTSPDNTQR